MIQSTPAERYPKVSYMRPEGTMEYYTDQTRPGNQKTYGHSSRCAAHIHIR
jgi:hypothetical protein